MKYTDEQRIAIILKYAKELLQSVKDNKLDKDMISSNQFVQWTVTTPLYNIGEQVYQLTDAFKQNHSDVPWNMIAGMRHRLIHDYVGINWSIITEAIFQHLPDLVVKLEAIK
ncbi:MAG: DUF86 domain-containing protein [Spirochaetales bacterium]|nr:DUF86 domain-containing protein [Spirochaetales bacterium]